MLMGSEVSEEKYKLQLYINISSLYINISYNCTLI